MDNCEKGKVSGEKSQAIGGNSNSKKAKKKSKKSKRKRKRSEMAMKNGNEDDLSSQIAKKKFKKTSVKDNNIESKGKELQTSAKLESFSVDMSKISPNDDATVKIPDLQRLILYSLLGPYKPRALPVWATLDHTRVQHVVVVLLKYATPNLFTNNEECFPNLGAMFDVVFPFKNVGHNMFIKSPAHSLLTIVQPKNENKLKENPKGNMKPLSGKDYILTEAQMINNDFLIPGLSKDAEEYFTIPRSSSVNATNFSPMYALDCEMCMSAKGRELTRISVVNHLHEVVFDSLVKPENPIVNYLTRYSGITKEDLDGIETTLTDVQEKLKEILPPDAIIIGHSLEFDFNSLKFFHNKVIDTSVIYGDGRGTDFKPSLKYLAKKYLKSVIQDDCSGHCSIEDAKTCMRLVQLKIMKGPEFGRIDHEVEKSIFDFIMEASQKKGVMIDRPSNIKQCSGHSDAIPCATDDEVVHHVTKEFQKFNFTWAQFHSLDSIDREKKAMKEEKLKPLLKKMDTNISEIHESLPNGTLFAVILGSADTSVLKSLRDQGAHRAKLNKAQKKAKQGLCFIKLVEK